MQTVIEKIQALYKKHTDHENDDFVNSLNLFAGGALAGDLYVNELIQNSDDAIASCNDNREGKLTITVTGNDLIVSHNGRPFDANDLNVLCTVGSPDNAKAAAANQTGNKGVGIKSLMTKSDKIIFVSHQTIFCFDKNYPLWKDKTDKYPWQVIPIALKRSDLSDDIAKHCPTNHVSYVITNIGKDRAKIIGEFTEFMKKPLRLVCLRSIKKIILNDAVDNLTKKVTVTKKNPVVPHDAATEGAASSSQHTHALPNLFHVEASYSGDGLTQTNGWLVYSHIATISKKVRGKFGDNKYLHERYEKTNKTVLDFIITVNKNKLSPTKDNIMSVTLPTIVKTGLPWHINADFLLDLSRQKLMTGDAAQAWNGFLIGEVYVAQLKMLQAFSKTIYWQQVPGLLSKPGDSALTAHFDSKSVDERFNAAVGSTPLLRCLAGKELCTMPAVLLDESGFVEVFGLDALKRKVACTEYLPYATRIREYATNGFGAENVLGLLCKDEYKAQIATPPSNKKLIVIFHRLLQSLPAAEQQKFAKDVREAELVLNQFEALCKLKNTYLPPVDFVMPDAIELVDFVHPELAADEYCVTALKAFGLNPLSLSEAVAKANRAKPATLIAFTNELIAESNKFTNSQWKALEALQIVDSATQIVVPNKAYFRTKHKPNFDLAAVLPEYPGVVHTDYKNAKRLLTKLGVCEELSDTNLPAIVDYLNETSDAKAHIAFVRQVFLHYYLGPSDYFTQKLAQAMRQLNLLTQTPKRVTAAKGYLHNDYQPTQKLMTSVPAIPFISRNYIEKGDNIQAWRAFFICLGAHQELTVEVIAIQKCTEVTGHLESEYINALRNGSDNNNNPYCPVASRSYHSQHNIRSYYRIRFIEELVSSPFFWKFLKNNWQHATAKNTKFESAYVNNAAPNALLHYASIAAKRQFSKAPSELYSSGLKKLLSGIDIDFTFAGIEIALTEQQQEFLGFRKDLSYQDCLRVLAILAGLPVTKKTYEILTVLYQQLSRAKEPDVSDTAELHLLASDGNFKVATELVILTDLPLMQQQSQPEILKIPKSISSVNIQILAHNLGVKICDVAECEVVSTEQSRNTQFVDNLANAALHLGFAEANYSSAMADDDSFISFTGNWLTNFFALHRTLEIYNVESLAIKVTNTCEIDVRNWLHNSKLYLIGTKTAHDKSLIMDCLKRYFKLKMNNATLEDLLYLSSEDLYESYPFLTQERLTAARAQFAPQLASPSANKKRKESDDALLSTPKQAKKGEDAASTVASTASAAEEALASPTSLQLSTNTEYDDTRYREIGWPGEQYVYQMYCQKYSAKAKKPSQFVKMDGAFKFFKGDKHKSLTWFNADIETRSNKPYDMVMITYDADNNPIKEKYIEVKATTQDVTDEKPMQAYFSGKEMTFLAKTPSQSLASLTKAYKLFCVFNVKNAKERNHFSLQSPLSDKRFQVCALIKPTLR